MPPALLSLVIFEIGSHFLPQAGLDHDPIYVSCHSWVTGMCHHAQLLSVKMGVSQTYFSRAGLGTSILIISASCKAGITGGHVTAQLLAGMGSPEFFGRADLEPRAS
jgi:hypothetical protein